MGNKRSRRSRRLATPSPERGPNETLVETPTQGNITLTNTDPNTQENLDDVGIRSQLIEPSQLSNEIQSWTENFEQKNNDRIAKMREEMENKLDAILKEIKSNKSVSMVTNPRSEENTIQNMQPSGSKTIGSIGVHASYNNNSDSENEDYPLRASKMRDLKHPAKPIFRSESDVDVTIHSDEESDAESLDEDYHTHTALFATTHTTIASVFGVFCLLARLAIDYVCLQLLNQSYSFKICLGVFKKHRNCTKPGIKIYRKSH